LTFKKKTEKTRELLYHSVDSDDELRHCVELALPQWAAPAPGSRVLDAPLDTFDPDEELTEPTHDLSLAAALDLAREHAASGRAVQPERSFRGRPRRAIQTRSLSCPVHATCRTARTRGPTEIETSSR
jgi:hypothetical protein